jgi:hypothetical protein
VTADDDQPRPGARYWLHRRYLVPVAAIELDEQVWAWVRRYFPADVAEPKERPAACLTSRCSTTSSLPADRLCGERSVRGHDQRSSAVLVWWPHER